MVAAGIFLTVSDPDKPEGEHKGSVFDLLKMPVMWAIFPLMLVAYAPSGALRGLWAGPYLSDLYGLSTQQVGLATLVMGAAMIAGTFAYGPLDRVLGTRKWLILGGNLLGCVALGGLTLATGRTSLGAGRNDGGSRFLRRVLSGDHGPWPRVCAAASGGAGGHIAEPLWHRRRGNHAVRNRPYSRKHDRTGPILALYGDFRLLFGLSDAGMRNLSAQPGQHGLIRDFKLVSRGSITPPPAIGPGITGETDKWVTASSSLAPLATWAAKC